MSDAARAFHREWLGMAQPIEGLVLSIPALIEADCFARQPSEKHREFVALLRELPGTGADAPQRSLIQPRDFFRHTLGWDQAGYTDEPPEGLSLYIPEGHQTLRPTAALKLPDYAKQSTPPRASRPSFTPAAQLGERYLLLYWELPEGLPLDKPETITGPWEYPPAHKFDRLLRECRVPIGVLCNHRVVRLIYAPHGEASGHIDFRINDMAQVHGRPLYDALVMLLGEQRLVGVAPDRQLHAMLARSRQMQAEVTTELAKQLYRALETLLAAFDAADRRTQGVWLAPILGMLSSDPTSAAAAASSDDDELYQALLTLLLRLVVLLYAEDSSLLPTDHPLYAQYYSLYALFERLEDERGRFPDAMHRRYSAYPGLLALFRAVYYGVQHGDFVVASHQGALFDPNRFAFLEGFDSKSAVPVGDAESRAAAQVPTIDDESIYQVLHALIYLGGERLSYKSLQVEQIGSVYEALMGYRTVRQDGRLVLVPGKERERTSSHYTPQALSRPLVSRALEPLLNAFAAKSKDGFASSEQILSLSVCDPAMGSGAFLVEATRILAEQLLAAWQREGHPMLKAGEKGDALQEAQRLIVERCIYGVDKNPFAVELAKISLWLLTMQRGRPFSFVDHNLRCGDSLVGLSFEQITSFHWQPTAQQSLIQDELKSMLYEAIQARLRITQDSAQSYAKKHAAMADADDALYRLRLIAHVVLGAFFKESKAKPREAERLRRLDLITRFLHNPDDEPDAERELKAFSEDVEAQLRPFHWHLEFPEIFYAGRVDPLTQETSEPACLDCVIGNPPFGGKNNIAAHHAEGYVEWLKTLHDGAHGNADLSAHFFRRADVLLGPHGTTGLVATNTIAQGDTRASSLQYLVNQGARIYNAEVSRPWPGAAAVTISTVHLAKGEPAAHVGQCLLDDAEVPVINSRLRPTPERPDPVKLADNEDCSFVGTYVLGMGFTLTPEEREALVAKDPRNAERIFPYLGGEEVNTSPTQAFDRYVISFGQMSLQEAEAWPDLIQIVREKVKPDRDKLKNNPDGRRRKEYWWQYGRWTPALYAAIAPLHRCLVTSIHSKHLLFAFQPTDAIFSHALYVFALDGFSPFAILQSRIHEHWAWLHSSTMRDAGIRYTATDCFETFPFPKPDPRTAIPELETLGETLYQRRADWMHKHNLGLTKLYNALKDPRVTDPLIQELRQLHIDLDRAVLQAYAAHTADPTWLTPDIPPYTDPQTPSETTLHTTFETHILDHLLHLNTQRSTQ